MLKMDESKNDVSILLRDEDNHQEKQLKELKSGVSTGPRLGRGRLKIIVVYQEPFYMI